MTRTKYTEEKINNALKAMGHEEITIDFSTFNGVDTKCRFIDNKYGEWMASPSNVLYRKSRHPKRGHGEGGKKKVIPLNIVKEKLRKNFGDLITIDESTYINGSSKARFIDKEYGEFWQRVEVTCNKKSCGHPKRGLKSQRITSSISSEEAYQNIKNKFGDEIELIKESFVQTHFKCKFKHKIYGIWEAYYHNIMKGHSHPEAGKKKQKDTMISKYGVEYPSQIPEIHLKIMRNRKRVIVLKHWKTNEDISCNGSYEYAVIKKLNELKIDYNTQIPFKLEIDGENKTYFVDLYLPDKDLYIEIKGEMKEIGKKKWEKFHKLYPNSELWQLKDVCEFTGLTSFKLTDRFNKAYSEYKSEQKILDLTE